MKSLIAALLLSAAPVAAATVENLTPEEGQALIVDVQLKGVKRWSFSCAKTCTLIWEEPKGGAVVYTDPAVAKEDLKQELLIIQDKIKTGEATKDDNARVVAIMLELLEKK